MNPSERYFYDTVKPRSQRTIKSTVIIKGIGIHTGKPASVTFSPGEVGSGVVIMKEGVEIPCRLEYVVDTSRCTTVGKNGVKVRTVEHLLASCHGLGIDNLAVKMDGPELPILDGSARDLALTLSGAGIVEQDAPVSVYRLEETVCARHGESFIIGVPADDFTLAVTVDYNHPVIGVQEFLYSYSIDFKKELAPARTFGFREELESLLKKNLAIGGSLDNALVVEKDGYMNPLRFDNEVVRHKCLDILGDLALIGTAIKGHIFAYKPGHHINYEFSTKLTKRQAQNG